MRAFIFIISIILLLGLGVGSWYYFSAQKVSAVQTKPSKAQKTPAPKDPFKEIVKSQLQRGVDLVCKAKNHWVFVGQDQWNPVRDEKGQLLIYTENGIYAAQDCFKIINMERHTMEKNGSYYPVLYLHTEKIAPPQTKQEFIMRNGAITPASS